MLTCDNHRQPAEGCMTLQGFIPTASGRIPGVFLLPSPCGCGSKPMVPFWGFLCTTHFRTYFSGDWGYDLGFDPWPCPTPLCGRVYGSRTSPPTACFPAAPACCNASCPVRPSGLCSTAASSPTSVAKKGAIRNWPVGPRNRSPPCRFFLSFRSGTTKVRDGSC